MRDLLSLANIDEDVGELSILCIIIQYKKYKYVKNNFLMFVQENYKTFSNFKPVVYGGY